MNMRWMKLSAVLTVLVTSGAAAQIFTEALLDTIQHTAFRYFWQEANPSNGLIKDRSQSGAPSSIAAVGFGMSAICIGVDHGWVTREAARDRVLTTLRTFWEGPQGPAPTGVMGYKGFFYHFLDMTTGTRTWTSELSTIDTGLLLAGILDARQYFSGGDTTETRIRALADSIYRRMDWEWFRNFHPGLLMQWTPETGFSQAQWIGYNEASIMYILALGSPSHPIDYSGWAAWTSGYRWQTHYLQTYVVFPPLFGHQYSHCWIDFRNIADEYMRGRGITYFENSRRATLAQRTYAIANPGGHAGYSDSLWGITASDTPTGYSARGAPPPENDDGTITPTAPISSIPFAPEAVIPVIHKMWNSYRPQLWTQYGFRDAFNLNVNWWDTDIIGIDQGPIIIMIENYLNQRVWNRFMQNADVQRGLQQAVFQPVTDVREEGGPEYFELRQNYPNPFNGETRIGYGVSPAPARPSGSNVAGWRTTGSGGGLGSGGWVTLKVYDVLGRVAATLIDAQMPPGSRSVSWDATGFPSGIYYYRLTAGPFTQTRPMLLLK